MAAPMNEIPGRSCRIGLGHLLVAASLALIACRAEPLDRTSESRPTSAASHHRAVPAVGCLDYPAVKKAAARVLNDFTVASTAGDRPTAIAGLRRRAGEARATAKLLVALPTAERLIERAAEAWDKAAESIEEDQFALATTQLQDGHVFMNDAMSEASAASRSVPGC
jgi:hypothetical protein